MKKPRPKAGAAAPPPHEQPSPQPGTRMLVMPPPVGDPLLLAAQSIESAKRKRPSRAAKARQRSKRNNSGKRGREE